MSSTRSPITTHILDLNQGIAAARIPVTLEIFQGKNQWKELAKGETGADGRIESLLTPGSKAEPGIYRMSFDTHDYFRSQGIATPFYPLVTISFQLVHPSEHYHIPLLLSPYGYSTYRGT
jgi:5-hydroxyisourate hydrolase